MITVLPLLAFVGFWILGAFCLSLRPVPWTSIGKLLRAAAGLGILYYVALAGWYLSSPCLVSHLEPTVICAAHGVYEGVPPFHALDALERTSVLYGPATSILYGSFLRGSNAGIVSAKLAVACALGLSILLSALLFQRIAGSLGVTLGVGYVLGSFLLLGNASFCVRPDILIVLCVVTSLWASQVLRRRACLVVCAVAIGIAVNLKAHAILYFAPLGISLYRRYGLAWVAVLLGLSMPVALAFFAPSHISVHSYVAWLKQARAHGFELKLLLKNLVYLAFFSVPVWLCLAGEARRGSSGLVALVKCVRPELLALGVASLMIAVVAAKPGAGYHHFAPLFPLLACEALVLVTRPGAISHEEISRWQRIWLPAAAVGFAAALLTTGVKTSLAAVQPLYRVPAREVVADIRQVMSEHPRMFVQVGYGEDRDYDKTYYRVIPVLAGHACVLDAGAMMDMQLSGLPVPQATIDWLSSLDHAIWLIPKANAPFMMHTLYSSSRMLFPDELRAAFSSHYEKRGSSAFFDIYFSRDTASSSQPESRESVSR